MEPGRGAVTDGKSQRPDARFAGGGGSGADYKGAARQFNGAAGALGKTA